MASSAKIRLVSIELESSEAISYSAIWLKSSTFGGMGSLPRTSRRVRSTVSAVSRGGPVILPGNRSALSLVDSIWAVAGNVVRAGVNSGGFLISNRLGKRREDRGSWRVDQSHPHNRTSRTRLQMGPPPQAIPGCDSYSSYHPS